MNLFKTKSQHSKKRQRNVNLVDKKLQTSQKNLKTFWKKVTKSSKLVKNTQTYV